MKTDPTPFIAAALSGIASTAIHHQIDKDGEHVIKAEHVAKRAVELGMAAAAVVDELIEAHLRADLEQPARELELEPEAAPEKAEPAARELELEPEAAPEKAEPAHEKHSKKKG